ncbi:MAG: hypothetical protein ABUR63_01035 [Verrucomicrobiota bacterium]
MKMIRWGVPLSLAAFLQLALASGAWAQAPAYPPPATGTAPAYPPPATGTAPAYPPPTTGTAPAYPPPATGTAPAPSAYPPGATAAPYAALVAGPIVTLQANHPRARLQQMQLKWQDVCSVPCGIAVDPNASYRVGGGTLRASDPFRLPRPSGPVLVDADVGSNVKHWVGLGLGIGGIVSASLGLLLLATLSDTNNQGLSGTTARDVSKAYGITYLIVGGILMAIGIPMWAGSNTSVQIR